MDEIVTTATSEDIAEHGALVAVLPVGSFEQHGKFLPLSTDTLIASLIATRIAHDYNLFLLPPITIACSHEHASYPGTVSITASTLYSIVNDVWSSVQASGYRALVIVNGHGGNYVLQNVVQEANRTTPQMTLFPSPWDVRRARQTARLETNGTEDMHGGELEVSLLLHGAAHVVRPGYETLDTVADWSQLLITGMSGTGTPTGLIGRPSAASAEKGQALLDCYSALFADHLKLLSTD